MAGMSYDDLSKLTYGELSSKDYNFESGGSEEVSAEELAALQSDVTDIKTTIGQLYSMITSLQSAVGNIPTTTYTVPSASSIATEVWSNNYTRSLSTAPPTASTIATEVWSSGYNRSLSTTPPDASTIASTVWGYSSGRTLTSTTVGSSTLATTSNVAAAVWNNGSGTRSLTTATLSDGNTTPAVLATPASVWSHTTRQLTSRVLDDGKSTHDEIALNGEVSITVDSGSLQASIPTASAIAEEVWTYTDNPRSLTTAALGSNAYLASKSDISSLQTHGDSTWVGGGSSGSSEGEYVAATINSTDLDNIAEAVWGYTDGFGRSLTNTSLGLGSGVALATSSNVAALQAHGDSSWATSSASSILTEQGLDSIAHAIWTYDSSPSSLDDGLPMQTISENVWNYYRRSLTTNELMDGQQIHNRLALTGSSSGSYTYDGPSAQTIAAAVWTYSDGRSLTTASIGSNSTLASSSDLTTISTAIAGVPNAVWTYSNYSTIHGGTPATMIANKVWGRGYEGTSRQLTSAILDDGDNTVDKISMSDEVASAVWSFANRKLTSNALDNNAHTNLALSTDMSVVINNEDIELQVPTASDIADAVWGSSTRSLTTTTVGTATLATSADMTTIDTAIDGIPDAVWSENSRTLTAATLASGALATTSDIPSAPDLSALTTITALLQKVFGVLCHWKIENDVITVYKDNNETLFTIPTESNKYGDIIKMGEIPTENNR